MPLITVITPCFNEEKALSLFYDEIVKVATEMEKICDFEFLLVNDGSKDGTMTVIKELAKKDKRVRYISFSRNFGKEAAILAGLEHAKGDFVTLMDADLQDPPSLLPEMYDALQKGGYDQVATRRVSRDGEPKIRSFFARLFYRLINKISDIEMVDGARDYRLMSRQVVDAIISMPEYNRYSKGLFSFVGFETKWIEYKNVKRAAGETKWSFWKLFKYAIEGIVSFSTVPLAIAMFVGMLISIFAFIMIIAIIVRTVVFGDPVSGWPSTITIILFIGGIQLLCMGIMGLYLSRAYLETKRRPVYIIKESK